MNTETPLPPIPPSRPTPDPISPNGPSDPIDPGKIPVEEPGGGTDDEVGDRIGPAVGYDQEPVQENDKGGVA